MKIPVIANPRPTFTWYKVTYRNRVKLGSGTSTYTKFNMAAVGKLTLKNVHQKNIGTYEVMVTNEVPRKFVVVNFTLKIKGMNIKFLQSYIVTYCYIFYKEQIKEWYFSPEAAIMRIYGC